MKTLLGGRKRVHECPQWKGSGLSCSRIWAATARAASPTYLPDTWRRLPSRQTTSPFTEHSLKAQHLGSEPGFIHLVCCNQSSALLLEEHPTPHPHIPRGGEPSKHQVSCSRSQHLITGTAGFQTRSLSSEAHSLAVKLAQSLALRKHYSQGTIHPIIYQVTPRADALWWLSTGHM